MDAIEEILKPLSKKCTKCLADKELNFYNKGAARYGKSSWCQDCEKIHYKDNFNHIKIQRKSYREKNKENTKAYNKQWYDQNLKHDKLRQKAKNLKHYFGITLEQFNSMVKQQNGKCKICESELDNGKGTHVDHCHETDKVRGILCHSCNTKLGWYQKNQFNIDFYLANPRDYLPSDFMLY